MRIAKIERIIDNKLCACFDGEHTRTKARDLFDLHFLAKHYEEHFNLDLASRLKDFSKDPDNSERLFSRCKTRCFIKSNYGLRRNSPRIRGNGSTNT